MDSSVVVMPGDDLTQLIANKCATAVAQPPPSKSKSKASPAAKVTMLGPGLRRDLDKRVIAVNCGQLFDRATQEANSFWLDSQFKRYIPSRTDPVIGFVLSKAAFSAKLDIGTNEPAILDLLAFPNATKKNKGQVEVGDAVYARIVNECRDIEAELVCVTSDNKKGGLGVLSNKGYVAIVPTHICRRLKSPDSKLIPTLGQKYKFEIAIGMNGRVWVCSKSSETTITIVNFIESLEHIPRCRYQEICEQLVKGFNKVGRQ